MRVVLAPDALAGVLSAGQVGSALAAGWRATAPGDQLDVIPLSDGGPGFVEVIRAGLGGELVPVTVTGPLGDPVPGAVLLAGDERRTAYVEAAEACGLHLLAEGDRDPGRATTYGVGELVAAAVAAGARRVVVGVGGTATNDGGSGLLAALGVGSAEELAAGGLALRGLGADALAGLAEAAAAPRGHRAGPGGGHRRGAPRLPRHERDVRRGQGRDRRSRPRRWRAPSATSPTSPPARSWPGAPCSAAARRPSRGPAQVAASASPCCFSAPATSTASAPRSTRWARRAGRAAATSW